MGLIVQKFGGTSVGSVERILKVAEKIIETKIQGNDVVVVVSAMGKSTDVLVDLAKQLSDDPPDREMDMLLTTGEQVSIALLAMALQSKGYPAVSLTGWQAGIVTESIHTKARIEQIDNSKIMNHLQKGRIVIVAGFQGVTAHGEITTLGRGGSDTTAVALAASLKADLCEIYTDVVGVFSADPRVVPTARKLAEISFDEMLELARLGAGVLHPRAVDCAKKYKVRLTVRSSFTDEEGTTIREETKMEKGSAVCGVAHNNNVAKITVKNMPNQVHAFSSLLTVLAKSYINVDDIIQSSYESSLTNISFSLSEDDLKRTLKVLKANKTRLAFEEVIAEVGLAKVSVVGTGMLTNSEGVMSMFKSLASVNIPIKMVSTSEIKVSCIIPADMTEAAVRTLHRAFRLDVAEIAVIQG
ncbi:aspartate kinase [Aneurinibacillus danicus]|uniref:Aspartokinase n=1 Tax=Aneurinibacillus danicus TaxID=267746 RepID=A0A511VDZ3_9BACL|nr:aspartate kinase [Aneurinibacillus danicus]GEN36651.1 aspartokinase 2 [Aneurinibacillus danicus]